MPAPRRSRLSAAITVAVVLGATLVLPASAANTITQTVNAGTRSASIADLSLGAVSYSHSAQTSTGTMVLTADDSSGTGGGWNVTVLGSDFVYSGPNGGANIPAANFSITSAPAATATAGEPVNVVGGPKVPLTFSAPATLDVARKVLQAELTFGEGTYTQNLGVSLSIPAQSRAGTFTGTMTVTIGAGP
mgnify:CR=1 FL=1